VAKWWYRLLAEAGALELPVLNLVPPEGERAKRLARGIKLLIQVGAARDGSDPLAFPGITLTPTFGPSWIGVSRATFTRAKGDLIESGWLTKVGTAPSRFAGTPTSLWLPTQLLEHR
jgi:hypothetical protein